MIKAVEIFIAYSRKDTVLMEEFRVHLTSLEHTGRVKIWYDGLIEPGAKWEDAIKQHLHASDIILLLVSSDAIASDYFYEKEVADALARHHLGEARVVPLIMRDCAWETTPLADLQALPKDGRPVTDWPDRDAAYADAVKSLWATALQIEQRRTKAATQPPAQKAEAAAQLAEKERLQREEEAERQRREQEQRPKEEKAEAQRVSQRNKEAEARRQAEIMQNVPDVEDEPRRAEPSNPPYFRWAALAGGALLAVFLLARLWGGSSANEVTASVMEDESTIQQPASSTLEPLAFIKGGTFQMGCTAEQQDCGTDEKPVTTVTVSDFYIGKYEETFEEYDAFCEATQREKPSDEGWGRGKRPVINVSWYDVVEYCNWRSGKENLTKVYTINGTTVTANWKANGYRLPTEAEWEYAAREGGKKVLFGNGKNVADPREINFYAKEDAQKPYSVAGEYSGRTVPVGSLNSPNALGLHDMSGNVWEWCWDRYATYPGGAQNSPRGADKGSFRVLRGGSWNDGPQGCRAVGRTITAPTLRGYIVGFRLARS